MRYFLFYLLVIPVLLVWPGYVGSILWEWFVVPLGASSISVFHASGLLMLFALAMGGRGLESKTKDERNAREKAASIFGTGICGPAFILLLAWGYRSFM